MVNLKAQSCCAGGSGSCSMGGGGSNILPDIDKHLVGVNYALATYSTTVYSSTTMNMAGMDMTMIGLGTAATGFVHTLQAYGRFQLPRRFQVAISVPVSILEERSLNSVNRQSGLGDLTASASYAFFNPVKFLNKKSKHQLKLGIGVKIPTGKFSMTNNGLFTNDLQLGTGSVDFLFNVNYTYRYRAFGLNLLSSYKKNLENRNQYRFGDNLGESFSLFYMCKLPKNVSIAPKLGSRYSHMFYNVNNGQALTGTGGEVLSATAGFDVYLKHLTISCSVAPVISSITHWEGEPVPILSFESGIFYSF
jgi:hypothetical protein